MNYTPNKTWNLFRLAPVLGALLSLLQADTVFAQYHNYNVPSGSDCILQAYRSVNLPLIYDAIHNDNVTSSDGGSGYFYGGFYNHQSANYTLVQFVCWPAHGSYPDAYDQQIPVFAGTNMSGYPQIGEGSSCAIKGGWPLFGSNLWYHEAMRCWQPADGTPHVGYQGIWMKDPTSGNWYHLGTFRYPFALTGVTGMHGWQENNTRISGDYRVGHAGGYYHKDGAWHSANSISFTVGGGASSYAYVTNDATYPTSFAASDAGPDFTNAYNLPTTVVLADQPALPVLDPIVVSNATASVYGSQLLVHWDMPLTSSPQLSYRVEVFNNASYTGTPAVSFYDNAPETREKMLTLTNLATPYVRLTISDIFFQTNTPILMTPVAATPAAATSVSGTVAGLNYQYYQSTNGDWTRLPDFSGLTPVRTGAVDFPDLTPRLQRADYGFNFTGYITAPTSGLYAFTMHAGDGARLIIDGVTVIDFDGLHNATQFKQGGIALAAGKHSFNLQYFQGAQDGHLAEGLGLAWEGPGIAKTDIPASAFSRVPAANEPTIALLSPANGATVLNSNPGFSASVTSNGASVNSVQFYLTDFSPYYFRPSQGVDYCIGQDDNSPFALNSMVWTAPTNLVRARLVYNNTNTLDSAPVNFVTTNSSFGAWNWSSLEMHNYPSGASIEGGKFTMIGDGMNLLSRQVSGDCTFIAHLAAMTPNVAGPDGILPDSGWRAGIILRSTTNTTIGTPLGNGSSTRFVALFSSVGGGTYFEDDTMRGGNGDANRWSGNLGGGNRWYKLQRTGDTFTSFVSTDGVNWTQVNSINLPGFGTTIYAGVIINAVQSANPNVLWASFDSYNLFGSGVVGPTSVSISPQTNAVPKGTPATFSASVVGPAPSAYQWQFDGANISGATNSVYSIANVTAGDVGNYTVVADSVTSAPAMLMIATPAGSGVWTNLAGGSWSAAANWSGGMIADGTDALADFSTLNLSGNPTVALDGAHTVGTLIFGDLSPAASHNWTLQTGSGGPLTLATSSGAPYVVVNNNSNTISAVVAGSQGFTKSGPGYLTLSGSGTFTGTVNVNAGTLEVQNKSGDTPYNIASGAKLKIGYSTGTYYPRTSMTINGNGVSSSSGFYLKGGKNYNSSGTIQLLGAPTTIRQYGSGLASIGVFDNSSIGIRCSSDASGSVIDSNIQMVSDGYGMTVQTDPGVNTATGDLSINGPLNVGNSSFYKRGTGSLALNGTAANGNIGVSIQAGTLLCGAVNCLGVNGNVSISSGAGLMLNGFNQTVGSLNVSAGSTLDFGGTGTLIVNSAPNLAGTLQMVVGKSSVPLSSQLVYGSGALTEGGALVVVSANGTAFAAGDTFTLFSAGGYTGTFASVALPPLPPGLTWDSSQLASNGTISVVGTGSTVWTGGGSDGNWSTAANWSGGTPTNGDLLTFQGTQRQANTNNILTTVGQGVFANGGFTAAGSPVTLLWGLSNQSGTNVWALDSTLAWPQSFVCSNGTLTVSGTVVNGGNDLTLDGDGNNNLLGAVTGAGGLTKVGSGNATLSGANTYAGDTTVAAGRLILGNDSGIPGGTGKGSVSLNGTLDVAGFSPTLNNLSGAGVVDNSAGGAPVVTVNSSAPTTFSGLIKNSTGTLSFAKSGTNTLTLTTAQTYAGSTTLSGGVLALNGGNNRLPFNTTVGFAANAGLTISSPVAQAVKDVSVADNAIAMVAGCGSLTLAGGQPLNIGNVSGGTATLDLSDLATFVFNNSATDFIVGGQNNSGTSSAGMVNLATNSTIIARNIYLQNVGVGGAGSAVNTGTLNLGQTTDLKADTLYLSKDGRDDSYLQYATPVSNAVLTIRATDGAGRANITLGSRTTAYGASPQTVRMDLLSNAPGGTLDALVGTLSVGNYARGSGHVQNASFLMGQGTLDATAIVLGTLSNNNGNNGMLNSTLTVSGGTVRVYTLTMGNHNDANGTLNATFNLNDDGTLAAQTIALGSGTATRTLNWNSGTIRNHDTGTSLTMPIGLTVTTASGGVHDFTIDGGRAGNIYSTIAGGGAISKSGAGTAMLAAANTYSGDTTVNAGTLAVGNAGSLGASPVITVLGGAELNVSAVGGFAIGATQKLQGYGLVHGGLTVNGTLAPGGSFGTLTFDNNLTLAGTTVMEIAGTGSNATNDQVVVTGQVTYGGTLVVTNIGANAFQAGDSFKLFSAGSRTGSFSSITVPPLNSPLYWTNRLLADGSIAVATAVNLTPTNLVCDWNGSALNLSWPADHIGWRLEAQTNALGGGLGTNWFTWPNSTNVNSVSMTPDPNAPAVFFRLVYP